MAASDSEEFESADEDYEYKEIKDKHRKLDVENISIIEETPDKEPKQIVELEKNINSTIKENEFHNNIIDEIKEEESHVSEDGWDDFGEDDWIDTIPESNKIDLNKAKESDLSNNPNPIFDNLTIRESFTEKSINKTPELSNTTNKTPELSNITGTFDRENEASVSWGAWKPWGGIVSSVFSAASEGVTTLTTLIESGIGAPNPESLVKIDKEIENIDNVITHQAVKTNKNVDTIPSSLGNLVSGVTNIGNKVITGGLDTLEGIGKKTMNILQENDPLLLQKRKFMGLESERPILSQVLREAKEKSEEVEKNLKQMQKQAYKKQLHFESLFDNYYGLVHLEALEMLSKQAAIKLQSLLDPLSGKALAELKETLNEVNELCDLGDLDINDTEEPFISEELKEKLVYSIEDLGIEISFEEILRCWNKNIELLDNTNIVPQEIYEYGLRCLAETCALQICKMHKVAELLIIKEHHSTANEADSLVQMTTIFCYHLHGIANKFCRKLNTFEQNEEVSSLITNLFLEVCNSTSYVQSAFKLFIPILQVGAA